MEFSGNQFLKQLLGRKPKATRPKLDDVRVQDAPLSERRVTVRPWGKSTLSTSGVNETVVGSDHASIIVVTNDGLIDLVKDFDTGELVERFAYHKEPKPCAGCGGPACYVDHKFGWRVCIDCDSDEIAADVSREAHF